MKCPFCKQKININLKFLFSQRCTKCNRKISEYNKRKYVFFTWMNVVICLTIFVLIRNFGNVADINETIFEGIAFILSFLVLSVLEMILLVNYCKTK